MLRAGFRAGCFFAIIQTGFLIAGHGHYDDRGTTIWGLAAGDFIYLPLMAVTFGLLLPLMRTIRGAVAVGILLGIIAGPICAFATDGFAVLHNPMKLVSWMAAMAFLGHLAALGVREGVLVKWGAPRTTDASV